MTFSLIRKRAIVALSSYEEFLAQREFVEQFMSSRGWQIALGSREESGANFYRCTTD